MKAYIIHLSKIPASLNSAVRLQNELASFGIVAELFEGSYGNTALVEYQQGNRQCQHWGIKGPDLPYDDNYRNELTTPGVVGCFDSHYRLWQKCVDLDEPILIFEDDAHIVRPFISVEWNEVLSVASSHTKKMGKYIEYLENPTENPPRAMPYAQSSMPGNAGYAIKPAAAAKLVKHYKRCFLPADNAINQHVVQIQIHSHMMGQAMDRERTDGKASLVRTRLWEK